MKNFVIPVLSNAFFMLIMPFILSFMSISIELLASYIVLGVAIYLFISSKYFSSKIQKSYFLIIIGIIFAVIMMYVHLSGVIVYQYLILYTVLMYLGIRLGNTQKRIAKLRAEIEKKD